MTAFSLRAALQPVWRGEAYYARVPARPPKPKAGERSVDPDGRERDMRSDAEAKRWAGERADVLAWLPHQGCTVYDLGCGDGKLKAARPDLDVIGYDPDTDALRVAYGRGVGAASELGFREADALWCCHVVEHMEGPWLDLAHGIARVRPGGLVIVETPDFGSPVAMEWGGRYRLLDDPTHVSLFTAESLVRMLRALNVEILEVAWPGWFGTPLSERRSELYRSGAEVSPPAPGNVVAVRGRKR